MNQLAFNFDQPRTVIRKPNTEAEKRDSAIETHKAKNGYLIEQARQIAIEICKERGKVYGPLVIKRMMKQPELAKRINSNKTNRWMGAVFQKPKGKPALFVQCGWTDKGSHKQPIRVWRLAGGDETKVSNSD